MMVIAQELLRRKLRSTQRGVRFHLRDMLGVGLLKLTHTTLGELLQIPK